MYRTVLYVPLLARRLTAGLIAALLVLAPMAPDLLALSGNTLAMCSLHGKNCTCPDMCAREHGGSHHHGAAPAVAPAPEGASCHRSATGAPDSKPDCQMKGCGKEEQVAAYTVQPPAEPALTTVGLLAPSRSTDEAYPLIDTTVIEAWLPPLSPPPRS